ncbi:hypothetical protein F5Y07DRAFT_77145 [Xylaria sp. FL0933]|nr:hypothetical protein F5Y07DRAFT_77145 [Xylaria sp. FL0933]
MDTHSTDTQLEAKRRADSIAATGDALADAWVAWTHSKDAKDLRRYLMQAVQRELLVGVKNIVCFGLDGPETWHNDLPVAHEEMREGYGNVSLTQHVAALWMAHVIEGSYSRRQPVRLTVYAHDKSYRDEDKEALSKQFKVLDSMGEAYRRVGADTLVFMMIGTDVCLPHICKHSRPAGIICLVPEYRTHVKGIPDAQRVLAEEYDLYPDWPMFYHPFIHYQYPGPQSKEECEEKGQRTLQRYNVYLRKPESRSKSGSSSKSGSRSKSV